MVIRMPMARLPKAKLPKGEGGETTPPPDPPQPEPDETEPSLQLRQPVGYWYQAQPGHGNESGAKSTGEAVRRYSLPGTTGALRQQAGDSERNAAAPAQGVDDAEPESHEEHRATPLCMEPKHATPRCPRKLRQWLG